MLARRNLKGEHVGQPLAEKRMNGAISDKDYWALLEKMRKRCKRITNVNGSAAMRSIDPNCLHNTRINVGKGKTNRRVLVASEGHENGKK